MDKKKNARNSKKLNSKEANQWLLQNATHPEYQSSVANDEMGAFVDNKLTRTKHGETLTTETRYGGFYWFGDLIMILVFAGFTTALIAGVYQNIKTNEYPMAVICTVLSILMICGVFYEYGKLRVHIKEKQKVKKEVKEGRMSKTKLKPGAIAYRVALFTFIAFFLFMLTGLVLSRLSIEMTADTVKYVGVGALIIIGMAAFIMLVRALWRFARDGWG